MRVLIGLGNPGKEYIDTRHNIGFWFLDEIKEQFNFSDFSLETKFQAEISKGKIDEEEIMLVKPQTFMNLSGETVQKVLSFYKLTPSAILVIHDDLDIKLGEYRLATDSSSAGHNGVQNIIDRLGTQKFRRLRIGIGRPEEHSQLTSRDYVLDQLSDEEKKTFEILKENIFENLLG